MVLLVEWLILDFGFFWVSNPPALAKQHKYKNIVGFFTGTHRNTERSFCLCDNISLIYAYTDAQRLGEETVVG